VNTIVKRNSVELSEYQKKKFKFTCTNPRIVYMRLHVATIYIKAHNHNRVGSCHSWDIWKSALFPDSRKTELSIISFMRVHCRICDTWGHSGGHCQIGVVLGNVFVQIQFPKHLFTPRTLYGHIWNGFWRFDSFQFADSGFIYFCSQMCLRRSLWKHLPWEIHSIVCLTCPGLCPWSFSKTLPLIFSNLMSEPYDCSGLVWLRGTLVWLRVHASTQAAAGTCTHLANYSVRVQLSPQAQECLQWKCASRAACMHTRLQRCFGS